MDNLSGLSSISSPSINNTISNNNNGKPTSSTTIQNGNLGPAASSTSNNNTSHHHGSSAISAMLSLRADLEAMKQNIVKQTLLRSNSTGSIGSPSVVDTPKVNSNTNTNRTISTDQPSIVNDNHDHPSGTTSTGGILLGSAILTSYFDNPESNET